MKKIHLLSGFVMLAAVATLFVACQKEQNGLTKETETASSNEIVNGVAVNANDVAGLISSDAADEMRDEFLKKYGKNSTQYVAFSTKDLANYLAILTKKYKSDSIYVNFGVYNKKTATSKANEGKLTVFFMGKNKNTKTGNIRTQAVDDSEDTSSNYLNHGGIYP
ncbi:hypothetical protein [Sediminibacterium ginsengisoli]|uniref:Uncharacterized protein n=1 Tax=Sediminibacterium ginsengisoli TaxID=413434 RepID=A0A1T4LUV3_9BACT|nr:hypothetical protein [Sediminibacterium ginsengisoli]SJZ58520.1 hypothetical protein SAMN04488132_10314 [Sediminibacterium ginsengisoli]